MKKRVCGNLIFTIFITLSFVFLISAEPPQINLISKTPANIGSTNLFNQNLNIVYNITDLLGLNASSVTLFYKTNSSTDNNIQNYVNGIAYSGFFSQNSINNLSGNFFFTLDHGEVYPTIANLNETIFENTGHIFSSLINNSAVRIELLNVSNSEYYNIFMFMANSSVGATPLYEFYCNSSYISGRIDTNQNCYQIGTLNATQTFPDSEMNNQYQFVGMTISAGMVGTVKVTPTSYFILRKGIGPGYWSFYHINQIARSTATQTTVNNGISWAGQYYTIDAHLHQFNGDEIFYYYACANDTLGNQSCSSIGRDTFTLGGLPPSSPHVYSPSNYPLSNNTYSGIIPINWVQAISPNGYAISYYNVLLMNTDGSLYKTIANNVQGLSYLWNSSTVVDGNYVISVVAVDSLGQSSFDLSEPFSIDNYHIIEANLANEKNNLLAQNMNLKNILILSILIFVAIIIILIVFLFLKKRKRKISNKKRRK
jgi:hypothetical protein